MTLVGNWYNELGSLMVLSANGAQLSGDLPNGCGQRPRNLPTQWRAGYPAKFRWTGIGFCGRLGQSIWLIQFRNYMVGSISDD